MIKNLTSLSDESLLGIVARGWTRRLPKGAAFNLASHYNNMPAKNDVECILETRKNRFFPGIAGYIQSRDMQLRTARTSTVDSTAHHLDFVG
ncbi:hypothetical protein NliqN6_2326 [Naganishia liquefaciens]|uniref:Uncharacterized protein n=1 Tax=Naganishia liquefaciens TaxID=104408 RepID=A0A8H3TTG2_9TREE|nr:hypothetical protein NliqN6_2326 [Naganishia liquefaciens]